VDILTQLGGIPRLRCVVDLGCGTGLSTRVWSDRTEQVIGIEPSDDMRRQAEARFADQSNVRFQKGDSTQTGLPDACADIVIAAQSLHWMEPVATFAEIARLLRLGGVFAAIDYDFMPTFNWEAQKLMQDFQKGLRRFSVSPERGQEWPKESHLERMILSGYFRYTHEFALHHVEQGSADRLCGLVLTHAFAQTVLKHGYTEEQIGVPEFRAAAVRILGSGTQDWYFTHRVRIGIR
jgi:ubiquinone/menaquinone biosynthesis C-methylase UbiE